MRERADRSAAPRRSLGGRDIAYYGLIVGAVVLGWHIATQPLLQRAPVELAIRLAPGSPLALRRAAESELAAGRNANAAALSRDALARSPFDVRALRVLGLAEARAGRDDAADEILTLAGNWSLRDDPAHAWLVERRLRTGDYASSFAHADTLVRRRDETQPRVFRLFTIAGMQDPQRALPVVAGLLAAAPPWRAAYLDGLNQSADGLQVAANLAVLLEKSRGPFSNSELQALYSALLNAGGPEPIKAVRSQLKRPPLDTPVTNGGFEESDHPGPFQWRLLEKAGIVAEIAKDDLTAGNTALRVDYDGYATGTIAEQLTYLPPGTHGLTALVRIESGAPRTRLAWTLDCTAGEASVLKASVPAEPAAQSPNTWTRMSGTIEVPANCPAQWLRLVTRPGDQRAPVSVWFDQVQITPEG